MKLLLPALVVLLSTAHGRVPNIYAAPGADAQRLEKAAAPLVLKNAGPTAKSNAEINQPRNAAGTFQPARRVAGASAGRKPTLTRDQQQVASENNPMVNFQRARMAAAAAAAAKEKTTIASIADWPWSGRQTASTAEHAPTVLVATVMTTMTKYAVLISTITTSIVELITSTTTETETLTRHSTRTIQTVTTVTNRLTTTRTNTSTETSTEFQLVPYTVTEVETLTETTEKVLLTTFTMPASTLHKTHWSTWTQPAATVTLTQALQPIYETVGTETTTVYSTVSIAPTLFIENIGVRPGRPAAPAAPQDAAALEAEAHAMAAGQLADADYAEYMEVINANRRKEAQEEEAKGEAQEEVVVVVEEQPASLYSDVEPSAMDVYEDVYGDVYGDVYEGVDGDVYDMDLYDMEQVDTDQADVNPSDYLDGLDYPSSSPSAYGPQQDSLGPLSDGAGYSYAGPAGSEERAPSQAPSGSEPADAAQAGAEPSSDGYDVPSSLPAKPEPQHIVLEAPMELPAKIVNSPFRLG